MTTIPVIPGVKVATKGILDRPIKDIICAILFGGLNNLLKGNLLCIEANLTELMGNPNLANNLKTALGELKKDIQAFQEHLGIPQTLNRINQAISDIQKVLSLGGMCPIPLQAPRIPNVINDVADSYFGAANAIIDQLGRLAKPQLCLDAQGGVNTGAYDPNSILGQLNRQVANLPNLGQGAVDRFINSINGVRNAIKKQINRELFPDFRHKHNLLTGKPVPAGVATIGIGSINTIGAAAIASIGAGGSEIVNMPSGQQVPVLTIADLRQAYDQAQQLVSSLGSTASFPAQCATPGQGAEVGSVVFGLGGSIESITLVNANGYEGYRSATVKFLDPATKQEIVPTGSKAYATGYFDDEGLLTEITILEPGSGYPTGPNDMEVVIIDETQNACPPGVQAPNMWINILGPELYALAVQALTPQDPLFTRQVPVYDYCGRLVGYDEEVVTGDRNADGGNPLDGAVTEALDLNFTFVWVDGTSEDPDRLGWGVEGYESEQLIGAPGAKKLTNALDLGPTITLYRGQSHFFSLPPGSQQEFYIYQAKQESGQWVPDITKRFSQGLHRFETSEYLDDANGRNEDNLTWTGAGNTGAEPDVWKRKDLYPTGTTLLFQIGEGDSTVGIDYWPEYLAYSNEDGSKFGLFKLV